MLRAMAVVGALVLAGCSAAPDGPDAPAPVPNDGRSSREGQGSAAGNCKDLEPGHRRCFWAGSVIRTPAASSYALEYVSQVILVHNETYLIEAQLNWTSVDGLQDVDLAVILPGCIEVLPGQCWFGWQNPMLTQDKRIQDDDGEPGSPDTPARVVVDNATIQEHLSCAGNCWWYASVMFPYETGIQVQWEMTVDLWDHSPGLPEHVPGPA